ncbi:hypothetical protein JW979_06365 [bacterium]|nr:hypothetical protein [candidate division CSSED10-310 bacterium]
MTYTRPGNPDRWEIGYIAEDLDAAGLRNLVFYDEESKPYNINYSKIILYTNEILKSHNAQIDQLTEDYDHRIDALERELEEQRDMIRELREMIISGNLPDGE